MNTPKAIYSPKRTYLVDTVNANFLIRGNEPLNEDGTFAYDSINEKLQTLITNGFDLKNYNLITISIIDNNPQSERGDLNDEFLAYGITQEEFDSTLPFPETWPPVYRGIDVKKQYGNKINSYSGNIIWYPVQGCTDAENCSLVEPSQFNFSGLIDYIHLMLETEKNTVVYYHCEHGHDRTGAVSAGYMLKYMNKSIGDVLTERPPLGAKAFTHPWASTYEALIKYYNSTL